MNEEHIISDEILERAQIALSKGETWMAYNKSLYFIEPHDVVFFKTNEEAKEFCQDNSSDHDHFSIMSFHSLSDIIKQFPYGEATDNYLNKKLNTVKSQLSEPTLEVNKHSITEKNFVMNEKNYEFLTDQLKKTGFGETLNSELREKMKRQIQEFTLNIRATFGNDSVNAILHFKRPEQSDMVFFNKYDLQLQKENSENNLMHSFYINKSNAVTLKEGYNLLDGRAVHKTLSNKQNEKYNAWLQLDLKKVTQNGNFEMKQYHQNYGFDLEKTLDKYPIKELGNDKFKESLINSLEKGNLQSATFLLNGKEEKIHLAANPAFKSLNAYDSEMKKILLSNLIQKNAPEQSQKQETKPELPKNKQVEKQNKVEKQDENKPSKKRQKQKVG